MSRRVSEVSRAVPMADGWERRLVLWPSVAACAAMLLWMGRAIATGDIPFTGDLLHWNYPIRDFYSGAIASGHRPWWMPSLFGGFDVAGEGQLGAFHPLHWLLYRLVPLDRAFAIELVAPYLFLLAGTWLFLRRVCDSASASFGAMLFAFCGFTLSHGVHMNMVAVVAHIPWMLWAVDRALLSRTTADLRRTCAVVAVLTGSQILLGHPQAVLWSAVLTAAYLLFRVAADPAQRPMAPLATMIAGAVLGAGIGAVQLLATFYEVGHSTRPVDDPEFATTFSLPLAQLLHLLEPYAFWGRVFRWNEAPGAGDEFGVYCGAVTLALTAWWMAAPRLRREHARRDLDRLAWWGLVLGAVGLWLATGRYGGLFYVETWIPIVREFRAPVRYVLFTHLGVALVSAAALTHLAAMRTETQASARQAALAPWALVLASTAGAAWLVTSGRVQGAMSSPAVIIGPVLFAGAALLVTLAARGRRLALAGLVLFAAADHGLYGLGGVIAWQDFVSRAEAEGYIDERDAGIPPGDGRVARGGFPNLHVLGGYRLIDGYAGLTPMKALDYRTPNALRVAGVRYANADFLGAAVIAEATPLRRQWFKLPAPLPRARLVTEVRLTARPAVEIAKVDVARVALVDRAMPLARGVPGSARIVRDDPGDIGVRIETPSSQLLVVSESFNAGWAGEIDGSAAPVERVNGDFLGVVVPAGSHSVALTFSPAYFAAGTALSLVSLVLTLVVALVVRPRPRKEAGLQP